MKKVLFIPGLGETAKAYRHQMETLSDLIEPLVFDYDAFETTDEMVKALIDILPENCTLIGHSMGGFLAQKCAANVKLAGLVLINTWAKPTDVFIQQNKMALEAIDEVGLKTLLQSQIPLLFYDQESFLVKETIDSLLEKPPEVYKRLFAALAEGEDLTDQLSKISAPTLIIHGRQDPLFSLEEHLHIQNHIPNAQLTIIEESGHNSPTEQPQAVSALLRLFFGE